MAQFYIACYGNRGDDEMPDHWYVVEEDEDPGHNPDGSCKFPDGIATYTDGRAAEAVAMRYAEDQTQIKAQQALIADPNSHVHKVSTPGLYLYLYHGFETDQERIDAENWGEHGPYIGPLDWVHVTYLSDVKIMFSRPEDLIRFGFTTHNPGEGYAVLTLHKNQTDCIAFGNMGYGDFDISWRTPERS